MEFIPFKMIINNYNSNTLTFSVEYIPENQNCYSVTHILTLDPMNPVTDANTIVEMAGMNSPQYFWNQLLAQQNFDANQFAYLANSSIEYHSSQFIANTSSNTNSSTATVTLSPVIL
jgi:hypothetical protein